MLPDLSKAAGIEVRYTNHSLRATSVTRMFNNGIPKKVIAESSGHMHVYIHVQVCIIHTT